MSTEKDKIYEDSLRYHARPRPGKTATCITKPCATPHDLTLAYSPGVAAPALAIARNSENSYAYTSRGNLVAVVTNGTAVLGLGNIGAAAAKPVMEGKCMLFKTMADIDAFDIEIDETDPEMFVECVRRMAPTFGGINLEDIKAPECFEIERRLTDMLDIPVMHDDQHGTAIVCAAAVINACRLSGKRIEDLHVAAFGAGAAAIAIMRLLVESGVHVENIVLRDSGGIVTDDRDDLTAEKRQFATSRRLSCVKEMFDGADVFIGVSKAGLLSPDMLRDMAPSPLIMALANPDPEIAREEVMAARPDAIYASGRSDTPNQVNNLLVFPYIFRGALDTRARRIDTAMMTAAAESLAELARRPVDEETAETTGRSDMSFGRDYIIPSPFDKRLCDTVTKAVIRAAVESGAARIDPRMGRTSQHGDRQPVGTDISGCERTLP